MEARAARRALARAAAVRARRRRAGKPLQAMTWSVIAAPRFSRGPGHVAPIRYLLRGGYGKKQTRFGGQKLATPTAPAGETGRSGFRAPSSA